MCIRDSCLDRGDFHPEPSQQAAGGIRGFTPLSEENPYTDALQKLTDAGVAAGLNPKYMPEYVRSDKLSRVAAHSRQYYEDFYRTFSEGLGALRERMNFLQGEIDQDEAALLILSHLAAVSYTHLGGRRPAAAHGYDRRLHPAPPGRPRAAHRGARLVDRL